jgi:PAS domain S-box-containing protein
MLPTVGLFGLFCSRILTEYQNNSSQDQKITLQIIIEEVDQLFDVADSRLQSLSREKELFSGKTECSEYLDSVLSEYTEFTSLQVIENDGSVLCVTKGVNDQGNYSGDHAFQQLLLINNFSVGSLMDANASGSNGLQVSFPIHNQSGTLSGILLGTLNPVWVESFVQSVTVPKGAVIYAVDQTGLVLFSKESGKIVKKLQDASLLQSFSQADLIDEVTVRNLDNTERFFKFAPLDSQKKIFIGVGLPASSFVSDTWQVFGGSIALLILITLASVIVAYNGIENPFIKQLNIISQTADKLTTGKFSMPAGMGDRNDEIGRLSQNFNRMALSLEEQRTLLENEFNAKLASQEKYFRLFEDSVLGIFKIDPNGAILDANPALIRMLGFSSYEELLENVQQASDLLQDHDLQTETIRKAIACHQPVHTEVICLTKDGNPFTGNLYIWGVWNASGVLEALEGFVEDISLAKQTQSQLKKLSNVVEQNPVGIIITDGKGVIEYANPGVSNLYGVQPEEIIGNTIEILFPKDTPTNLLEGITRNVKNEKSQQGEIKTTRKNGEVFCASYRVTPIVDEKGESRNSLILIEDISLRHSNQEQLTALRTIDLAIISNMDLAAILNIIIHLAEKHLGVDAVIIQKYDAQFNMLHTLAQLDLSQAIPTDIPFPASADMKDRELIQDFSVYIPLDSSNKCNQRGQRER